jgi:hypothetical protein
MVVEIKPIVRGRSRIVVMVGTKNGISDARRRRYGYLYCFKRE